MKRLATLFVVASLMLGLGSASAADLAPRGWEVTHVFADNTTPYDVLLTAVGRTGTIELAEFVTITATDSVRVVPLSPRDYLFLTAAQTSTPAAMEGKVNKYLRYRPGGVPLMIEGPLTSLSIYGPAGGGTVTLTIQAEY